MEHPDQSSLGVLAATLLAGHNPACGHGGGAAVAALPTPIVAIFTFFIRYVDVVSDQYHRMRIAQEARGFRATSPRSWPTLASMLGALSCAPSSEASGSTWHW